MRPAVRIGKVDPQLAVGDDDDDLVVDRARILDVSGEDAADGDGEELGVDERPDKMGRH